MLVDLEKYKCCGCSACAEICTRGCITMEPDGEGFLYPIKKIEKCITCGLCEKVCPERNMFEKKTPIHVYAAQNLNDVVRGKSSSGGIFYLLAQRIFLDKGVVFGVRFNEKLKAVFDYAENVQELDCLLGSKYVQAQVGDAYKKVKCFLRDGRWVMFSGTPCQIAGLKRYLQKDYERLLTVDIACHGVPSPKVWDKYVGELQKKRGKIERVDFRSKKMGWKHFMFSIIYRKKNNFKQVSTPFWNNLYMRTFLSDIILRPSCYHCMFKDGKSNSDITIGDYWGIKYVKPNMDDNKGTSIIIVNTKKGYKSLEFNKMSTEETTYSQGCAMNPALVSSSIQPLKRKEFFYKMDKSRSIIELMEENLQGSLKEQLKRRLKLFKLYMTHLLKTIKS